MKNKTPSHILWKRSHGRAIAGFNQLANKQSPTAAVYEWSSERSGVNGEALRMIFTQSRMPPHFPIATFPHCNVISMYIKQSPTAAVYEWSIERSGVNGEALRMIFTQSHMTTHFPIYSFSHSHILTFSHFLIGSSITYSSCTVRLLRTGRWWFKKGGMN